MSLKYSIILKILKDYNFVCVRSKWSHFRFEKNWYWLTVWFHDEYPPKTAKNMLKDIAKIQGIEYMELVKQYNIKL